MLEVSWQHRKQNSTEHDEAVREHNRRQVIVRDYALMARLIELGSEDRPMLIYCKAHFELKGIGAGDCEGCRDIQ